MAWKLRVMNYLTEFTEHSYDRISGILDGVTDVELQWNPVPEMNNGYRILRHMARISLILLPQVIEGTTKGQWNDDYEKKEHPLHNMLNDLEGGRMAVVSGLKDLKDSEYEDLIPLWGGRHRRVEGIHMLVSELVWHAGQIALIRGAYKRANTA